jgi:hypothetical protein
MKSITLAITFLALSLAMVMVSARAEEDCNPDGKSYGAKTVNCNATISSCMDSSIEYTQGGAPYCVPNRQITRIYGVDTACQEIINVTGTKKVCIDWFDPATNQYVTQVCYDYNDCTPTPTTFSWECTAGNVQKEFRVAVKATADCRDVLDPMDPL